MALPLFRHEITGRAVSRAMDYAPSDGDEVEDLWRLLTAVKKSMPEVEAVSCGAVLSNYQRTRVENVCDRLGLVSLCYMWRRNQTTLLKEMIAAGVDAILIKTAAYGLDPRRDCGKSISEMLDFLCEMESKIGLNVCGEGGEYETFTLDCPLFQKRIVIGEQKLCGPELDNPICPVGYLHLGDVSLAGKDGTESESTSKGDYSVVKCTEDEISLVNADQHDEIEVISGKCCQLTNGEMSNIGGKGMFVTLSSSADDLKKSESIGEELDRYMGKLEAILESNDMTIDDVFFIQLFVSDMGMFGEVNQAYKKHFAIQVPSRACVEVPFKDGKRLQIDVLCSKFSRDVLHVRSVSRWAPSCIGPYSQASTVASIIFLAGQIALHPPTMKLVAPRSYTTQTKTCFENVSSVLECLSSSISQTLTCFIWVAGREGMDLVQKESQRIFEESNKSSPSPKSDPAPVLYISVPRLPKDALVEIMMVNYQNFLSTFSPSLREESIPFLDGSVTLNVQSFYVAGRYMMFAASISAHKRVCTSEIASNIHDICSRLVSCLAGHVASCDLSVTTDIDATHLYCCGERIDEKFLKYEFLNAMTSEFNTNMAVSFIPVLDFKLGHTNTGETIFGFSTSLIDFTRHLEMLEMPK
eukprot:743920_1